MAHSRRSQRPIPSDGSQGRVTQRPGIGARFDAGRDAGNDRGAEGRSTHAARTADAVNAIRKSRIAWFSRSSAWLSSSVWPPAGVRLNQRPRPRALGPRHGPDISAIAAAHLIHFDAVELRVDDNRRWDVALRAE